MRCVVRATATDDCGLRIAAIDQDVLERGSTAVFDWVFLLRLLIPAMTPQALVPGLCCSTIVVGSVEVGAAMPKKSRTLSKAKVASVSAWLMSELLITSSKSFGMAA